MPQYLSPGVYVEEVEPSSRPIEGVGTAVAAFAGLAERGPFNAPTLVTNWTQFQQTFGEFVEGSYLAHAVYGYFQNGGGSAYVVRIGSDGNGQPKARAALPGAKPELQGYTITALEAGSTGNEISVEVADASEGEKEETFKLIVKQGGKPIEEYDNLTVKKGKQHVATVVNAASKVIQVEEVTKTGEMERRPPSGTKLSLAGGAQSAPQRVTPDDYVGDPADRTGFGGLEAIDEITMIAVPDLMAAYNQGLIDIEGVKAVQLAMIAHCELMGDRVAVLDAPPNLNAQQVKEWRVDKAGYDSKYATLYWPWIKVMDPASGQNIFVPPSGHMAGLWAQTDGTRGVHKAPANLVVRGAIDLETNITKNEHDLLNPIGVNCIRKFPGKGIKVWGARTLSSDSAWRYINIRRFFNFVEESILSGTDWVVFEPNDMDLWQRVKRSINAFLTQQWRNGALFGATPDQAFYVKCDEENNPPDSRDAGQLIVEIGLAPVKPAEFVIFRIQQVSGNASVSE